VPPRLDGGRLCLDFANTVGGRGTADPSEFLTGYAVLVAWTHYAGAIDDETGARLRRVARNRPDEAAAVHREAIAFRDTLYRLFVAVAKQERPARADLDALRRLYRAALDHARLGLKGAGLGWEWEDDGDDLARPLWAVAWSAIDLLTAEDTTRIKVCPGGDGSSCFWVFYDATKNRIRRWCSMEECGTNSKVRRQTARRRATRAGRSPS
jgi:predicted RNA-binding Zn ribbon-like protein